MRNQSSPPTPAPYPTGHMTTPNVTTIENAAFALLEDAAFKTLLSVITHERDEHERINLGSRHMADPKETLAYHLGYIAGLNFLLKRPAAIAEGALRPPKKKAPASFGATIGPLMDQS